MPDDQNVVVRAAFFHLGQLFCEIPIDLDERPAWVIEANNQLRLAGVSASAQIPLEPANQVENAAQACWPTLYLEAPPLLAAIWQCSLLLGQLGWFFRCGLRFGGPDPRWAETDRTFFDTARLNTDLEPACFERIRRGAMAIAGRDMNGYLASVIEIFNTRIPVSKRSAHAANMLLEGWSLYTLIESHQIEPADVPAFVRDQYIFARELPPRTQAQREHLLLTMTGQYERLVQSLLCDIHLCTWRPLDLRNECHLRIGSHFDETTYTSIGDTALGVLQSMKLTRNELTDELGARLFRDQMHEYYIVLVLDASGALAGGAIVTSGRPSHVDLSLGQMKLSLLNALIRGDEVIVIHNHPSGIGLASQQDVVSALHLDRELVANGLSPRVRDLVIFAGGTVRSYAPVLAALQDAALPLADATFRDLDQRLGEWKVVPVATHGDPRRAGELVDGNRRGLLQIALLRAVRKLQPVSFTAKADSRFYELAHSTGVAARAADIDAAHSGITWHAGRICASTALLDHSIQTVADACEAVAATFAASKEPVVDVSTPGPKSPSTDLIIALYGMYTAVARLEPDMDASRRRHEQMIDKELSRLNLIEVLGILNFLPADDPVREALEPRAVALLRGRDPTLRNESWLRRAWRALFG